MNALRTGLAWCLLAGVLLASCGSTTPAQQPPTTGPTATTAATQPALPTVAPPSLPPTTLPNTPPNTPLTVNTIQDWHRIVAEIANAAPGQAQVRADAVWQALAGAHRVPLILGDQIVFLYKGPAQSVVWRGVFTYWGDGPGLDGRRVGATDLWVAQTEFPPASRAEYKIVLNDNNWILDPANPATVASGDTTNNLLVMPGFASSDESIPRPGVITGTLSENQPIASRSLGYTVNYRVYTPPGYATLSRLPVVYVLDGSDFINPRMGAEPIVLDNLLAARRIKPVIVVFVDPYEPGNPKNNRREAEFLTHSVEYAHFVATEMVPAIDRAYRTDPRPAARIIQGVSYGGLSATFIAASYPQVFHNLAALSPSIWVLDNPDGVGDKQKAEGALRMAETVHSITNCGGDTGIACPALPLHIFLSYGVPAWDVGDFGPTVAELQREGYAVRAIHVNEGHAWSAWRGLLDELLITFLGT